MIEKIQESANASSVKLLRTTPQLLRELANRLEAQAKQATLPGELVVYPLTRSLTLVYEPEVSVRKYKNGPSLLDYPNGPGHPDDLEGGP